MLPFSGPGPSPPPSDPASPTESTANASLDPPRAAPLTRTAEDDDAPIPSPGIGIITPSPFAFAGADSDASSDLASDDEDDRAIELQPVSVLSSEVRPSLTRREPPPSLPPQDAPSADGSAKPRDLQAHDYACQNAAPTMSSDRSASPASITLPVRGDTGFHREVRFEATDRPDHAPRFGLEARAPRQQSLGLSEEDVTGVFAFQRPPTAPQVPGDTTSSGTLADTPVSSFDAEHNMMEPAPVTGYAFDEERRYNAAHPPPYSGRDNLNNGVFAFSLGGQLRRRQTYDSTEVMQLNSDKVPPATGDTMSTEALSSPGTGNQLFGNLGGRFMRMSRLNTGRSARPSTGRPSTGRPSTMSDWTDDTESQYRPHTMQSRMTELTGDATIPDGVTTWGDGVGGELKSSSDPEEPLDWIEEDSPYAEVRASVSNIDDPDMPALTLRAWLIGIFLCAAAGGANVFFLFRNPSPQLPLLVVQVIAYPLGRFLAWCLPMREWTLPWWLGGRKFSLNPCPFNVKEHTIIMMMANVSIAAPYALNTMVISDKFYHRPLSIAFNFLYALTSQMIGLSMAGIARRFVVWPASMIWPGVLVSTTNINTLHAEADAGAGSITRLRFFMISSSLAFAYYFLPGFLFTALSYFSWVCWIFPDSNVVNQLFGVSTGLGMGIFTFDWAQIAWIGSPLAAPWWAQVNICIGFVLFYWIIVPIIFYKNAWYTQHVPISSLQAADRFGNVYNVSSVLTSDYTLNTTAYAQYSQVYLTASFTMTYMLAYALVTSLIVYTALVHGRRIVATVKKASIEPEDIHMRLMKVYPEIPDWWFLVSLTIFIIMGIVTVEVFPTHLPVWGYLVSLLVAFIYILPACIMYALSNLRPSVNLIAELIPGYLFQGQPLAGMIFKTFCVSTLGSAMEFAKDMKAGHYMKVPPRSMFIAQLTACAICTLVQIAVKEWMFTTIPDMCSYRQKDLLTCAAQRIGFAASIIWGLIGPERLFSKGGIYNPQLYMLFVGAILPVPFWLWCRKHPKSVLRNINVTLMFCVCIFTPPATGFNISSFLFFGFIFQYWIRRYRFAWWSKYNYVLSAALDVGTMLAGIFVFMTLKLPNATLNWWGNNVYWNTKDWMGTAVTPTPPGGFGPDTWKV